MIDTTWERPQPHEKRFVALLCYDTTLAALKPRKSSPDAKLTSDMFGSVQAAANSDDVVAAGWQDYRMRLPFTAQALRNRAERGADVPEWWTRVDTFTLEAA